MTKKYLASTYASVCKYKYTHECIRQMVRGKSGSYPGKMTTNQGHYTHLVHISKCMYICM